MAKWWREEWKQQMGVIYGPGYQHRTESRLDPVFIYNVRVCGFTFHFASLDALQECLDYYRVKIHPSRRLPRDMPSGDHDESQRWFEELPLYLREEAKRVKIVAALTNALQAFVEMAQKEFHVVVVPEPGPSPVPQFIPDQYVAQMTYWQEAVESEGTRCYIQVKGFLFVFATVDEIELFARYWRHRSWESAYRTLPEIAPEALERFQDYFEGVPDYFHGYFNRYRLDRGFDYVAFELRHLHSGVVSLDTHPRTMWEK